MNDSSMPANTASTAPQEAARITLKLMATLTDYLPPQRQGNQVALDLAPGTTIDAVIARFRLPPELAHLVLVDGVYVPPEQRGSRVLRDGETLAIWPPVAGG